MPANAARTIFLKDGAVADETVLEPRGSSNGRNAETVAGKVQALAG